MARFQRQVLSAVAELERELIRERVASGNARYRQDWEAGRVGKTVHSLRGKDLPPHRPKKVFDRQAVVDLYQSGVSMRQIAKPRSKGPLRPTEAPPYDLQADPPLNPPLL
jgi:DNA invertase Pin-like site-specific DNA recombinase